MNRISILPYIFELVWYPTNRWAGILPTGAKVDQFRALGQSAPMAALMFCGLIFPRQRRNQAADLAATSAAGLAGIAGAAALRLSAISSDAISTRLRPCSLAK